MKEEFDNVFLEFDDEETSIPASVETESDENTDVVVKGKTTKISLDELQKRLDETQALKIKENN